jgi:hypothetical protein
LAQRVRSLERALLLSFKAKFGEVPKRNYQGKGIKERDEYRYFQRSGVTNVIEELS